MLDDLYNVQLTNICVIFKCHKQYWNVEDDQIIETKISAEASHTYIVFEISV